MVYFENINSRIDYWYILTSCIIIGVLYFTGYFMQYVQKIKPEESFKSWYSIVRSNILSRSYINCKLHLYRVVFVVLHWLEYFSHLRSMYEPSICPQQWRVKFLCSSSSFQKSRFVSWNDPSFELEINSIADDNLAFSKRKIGISCVSFPPRDSTRWNTYSFLAIDYSRQIHRILFFLVEISRLTFSVKYFQNSFK